MLGQSPKIACHGCDKAYCCRNQQSIQIADIEFEQLKHIITDDQLRRAKKEIDSPRIMFGKNVYTCPFNDPVTGACEIYANRFIVCAGHGVVGPTEEVCNTEGSNTGTMIVNPMNTLKIACDTSEEAEAYLGYVAHQGQPTDILECFKKLV